MKFGVDAPWYDGPVERMAFNLYAMDCERLNEIANDIIANGGVESAQDIVDKYNIKYPHELDYILERIGE